VALCEAESNGRESFVELSRREDPGGLARQGRSVAGDLISTSPTEVSWLVADLDEISNSNRGCCRAIAGAD
jgi:hypothetical protein